MTMRDYAEYFRTKKATEQAASEPPVRSSDLVRRWEELGKRGVTVSICFGRCGDMGMLYSVDARGPDCQIFDKPYAAETLEKAIHIAEKEATERGWIAPNADVDAQIPASRDSESITD